MRIARQHTFLVGLAAGMVAILALALSWARLAQMVRAVNREHAQGAEADWHRACSDRIALKARCLDVSFQGIAALLRLAAAASSDGGDPASELAAILDACPQLEGVFLADRGMIRTVHGSLLAAPLGTVAPSLRPASLRAALPTDGLMLFAIVRGNGSPGILGAAAVPSSPDGTGLAMVIWTHSGFAQMLAPTAGTSCHPVAASLVGVGGQRLAAWPEEGDVQAPPPAALPPTADSRVASYRHPLAMAVDAMGTAWQVEQAWAAPGGRFVEVLPGIGPKRWRAVLLTGAVATVAAMLLFLAILSGLDRHAFAPLRQALEFAQRLSRGEFAVELRSRRRDEFGELCRALNAMRDRMQSSLTRLRQSHERERQAREELETASRLRSEFFSRLSDDLRPPIDFILTTADSLRDEARTGHLPEGLRRQAEGMYGHARRLHDLIGSMLSLV